MSRIPIPAAIDEAPPASRVIMQIDRTARETGLASDHPASDGPAPVLRRGLRERLRRPLLVAFPILLAVVGAADYLAEEP
jgi:hypothetical protein